MATATLDYGRITTTTRDLEPEDRFWSYVDRHDPDGCWPWLGAVSGSGHGELTWDGRNLSAHRIAWELEHGSYPREDEIVDQTCRNKLCMQPQHQFMRKAAVKKNCLPKLRTRRNW